MPMTRPVDQLGRVVIPMETRKWYNIKSGDKMQIFVDGSSIVLRPYQVNCLICEEPLDWKTGLKELHGKYICEDCAKDIAAMEGKAE